MRRFAQSVVPCKRRVCWKYLIRSRPASTDEAHLLSKIETVACRTSATRQPAGSTTRLCRIRKACWKQVSRARLDKISALSAVCADAGSMHILTRGSWRLLCSLVILGVLSTVGGPQLSKHCKECTGEVYSFPYPQLLATEAAATRKRVLEVRRDPATGVVIYPQKPQKKKTKTPLAAPRPIRILKKDSFPTFLDLHKKVIVHYYATDRCQQCMEVRREVDEVNEGLVKYFYSTTLAQVDVALEPVLADEQNVTKVPALLFYEEGTRSPPEIYSGKWTAKRILDWVRISYLIPEQDVERRKKADQRRRQRASEDKESYVKARSGAKVENTGSVRRQDGSFIREPAAARLGSKAPLSAEDEETALKTAAANSPFVTVFAYVVPGSAKEKLVKDIASEGTKLRATLVHIIPVQNANDSRVEVHKARLPYDLYEEEKVIDYGPAKWSKQELQRILWEAQQRIIYPEQDDLVDELSKKKSLATILFDEQNSDHQEYVDLFLDYAEELKKDMVFTFVRQKEARKMENYMGLETGWPTLLITESLEKGRRHVLESGSYTYHAGPRKYKLNGPFSWAAADLFFQNYKQLRLPTAYRSILPPDRTSEIVEAGLQDLCHHSLKALLGGLGKWIFVLYYDFIGCKACDDAMKVWIAVARRAKKWTVKDIVFGRFPTDLNDPVDAASTLQRPLLIGYPPTGSKLKEHIVYEGEFDEEEIVEFVKSEIRRRWKQEEL